jgi:hypothetical protein
MIKFYPYRAGHPYVYDVKSHDANTLVFDGHFYGEAPIRLVMVEYEDPDPTSDDVILVTLRRTYIEIYEKISGPDTSSYTYSDDSSEDDGICLFPTEITMIRYRVLQSNLTREESDRIILRPMPDPDRA